MADACNMWLVGASSGGRQVPSLGGRSIASGNVEMQMHVYFCDCAAEGLFTCLVDM